MATDFFTTAASVPESEDAIRNLKASESVTAAFNAAGIPNPPGDLANIVSSYVKSATRDIPLNQIAYMSPGSGSLGTSAATGVTMFFSTLTPAQRDAVKQGINPLDPAAMMTFNAMINGITIGSGVGSIREGGAGRATSDTYTRELAGGSVAKALSNEGYSTAQIGTAVAYASGLGVSEDMARKFIKLDKNSREDLKTFVDDIRNDASLSEEQKLEKFTTFNKAHPKIGKVLTKQDMLKIIRAKRGARVDLEGEQKAEHDTTQGERVATNRSSGVEQQVERDHARSVASAERRPDEANADLDVFAAATRKAKSREVAESKLDAAAKPDGKSAYTADSKPPHSPPSPDTPRVARAPAKSPSLA